jgi:hypothetical protein
MVLSKFVSMGTLFHIDFFIIECNSSLISTVERPIGSTPSPSKPKKALATKIKLLLKKKNVMEPNIGPYMKEGATSPEKKNLVDGLNNCAIEFYFCENFIYG